LIFSEADPGYTDQELNAERINAPSDTNLINAFMSSLNTQVTQRRQEQQQQQRARQEETEALLKREQRMEYENAVQQELVRQAQ